MFASKFGLRTFAAGMLAAIGLLAQPAAAPCWGQTSQLSPEDEAALAEMAARREATRPDREAGPRSARRWESEEELPRPREDFLPARRFERREDESRQENQDELKPPRKEPAQEPPPVEEDQEEEKEEKKWYDKLGIRGYGQFRYTSLVFDEDGSAPMDHSNDSSVAKNQEFFIRRLRVALYGDVSDRLYLYFQPDFVSTPDGSVNAIQFAQIRDFYGDLYLDDSKVHRLRIGQSKVPYGWENMQSSQNRISLDRADALNSGLRNERDLGVFYYWTPEWAQETFRFLLDEGYKGSGNFGVFGIGVYNGQGGSMRELNDELHLVARVTLPYTLSNGQIIETGMQGYTGQYVVSGSPILPLGIGPAITPDGTRGQPSSPNGHLDQRLAWSFNYYPMPFGVQAEYTIGRGPQLNAAQTAVERGDLHGGYIMLLYRLKTACWGEFFPYARYHYYEGGYKTAANAPYASISEWHLGVEWQIRKECELVCEYLITDRTNLRAQSTGESYGQFVGHLARLQFQINF